MPKEKVLLFKDIVIGRSAQFGVTLSQELIEHFAEMTGDFSPLHTDMPYAAQTPFKKPVAHGLLVGSFLSRLVGMHLPGRHALYLSQKFLFRKPVYPGAALTVRGTVTQKTEAAHTITLHTEILDTSTGECVIDGEAVVKLLS